MREIKVRYKQSYLGAAWAILQPLSLMLMFTLVFSFLVPMPTGGVPYPVFSYSALLPWTFFATSITFGTSSVVNNMQLVTKIYFPREILPLAAVGAGLVDFAIASCVFIGMMAVYQLSISVAFLFLPVLLVVQLLLTWGLVLLASAVNVFYRDIRFVVPLAVQLWMYATPVIYPSTIVPEQWRGLYMLNPMAGIIEGYRAILLFGRPPNWRYISTAIAISVALFAAGYAYFKHSEPVFSDLI